MSIKSLGNPYDDKVSLVHTINCQCEPCKVERLSKKPMTDKERTALLESQAEMMEVVDYKSEPKQEEELARARRLSFLECYFYYYYSMPTTRNDTPIPSFLDKSYRQEPFWPPLMQFHNRYNIFPITV